MKLYQIRTKNVHLEDIEKIVSVAFPSFDTKLGRGCWEDIRENSVTIEIYATDADAELVLATVQVIKELNKQEVLLLVLEASGRLI